MPNLYIIAGPNGAGKTTAAMTLLPEVLHVREFVNADEIARGLSPFNVEGVALQAGRLMLQRIKELAEKQEDFAFETTLASKSFAPFIRHAQKSGYTVNLIFLWLANAEIALKRVATRVANGGHNIPEETVRRRYKGGLRNLFQHYIPVVDGWEVYDNSSATTILVASSIKDNVTVHEAETWNQIKSSL